MSAYSASMDLSSMTEGGEYVEVEKVVSDLLSMTEGDGNVEVTRDGWQDSIDIAVYISLLGPKPVAGFEELSFARRISAIGPQPICCRQLQLQLRSRSLRARSI